MDKYCGKCKETKPVSEFAWKNKEKGTLQYQCRACQYKYRTEHYRKNKEKIYNRIKERQQEIMDLCWQYKSEHPCVDCGESDPVVLEFDHLRDKEFSIADMVQRGMSWERILTEIAKCEVVCCNDHRRRTHERAGWVRNAVVRVSAIR